jgi:hypothetical protein
MNDEKILVSDLVNEYRDCCRTLWNRNFLQNFRRTQNWDLVDSYKVIKEELFQSCVLAPVLGSPHDDFSLGHPSKLITINFPKNYPSKIKLNRNTNRVNNIDPSNAGYWDHSVSELDSAATVLFVDHFDWDPYGFLDMTLVMGEILNYPKEPQVQGHRLLIESSYVDIFMDPSEVVGP